MAENMAEKRRAALIDAGNKVRDLEKSLADIRNNKERVKKECGKASVSDGSLMPLQKEYDELKARKKAVERTLKAASTEHEQLQVTHTESVGELLAMETPGQSSQPTQRERKGNVFRKGTEGEEWGQNPGPPASRERGRGDGKEHMSAPNRSSQERSKASGEISRRDYGQVGSGINPTSRAGLEGTSYGRDVVRPTPLGGYQEEGRKKPNPSSGERRPAKGENRRLQESTAGGDSGYGQTLGYEQLSGYGQPSGYGQTSGYGDPYHGENPSSQSVTRPRLDRLSSQDSRSELYSTMAEYGDSDIEVVPERKLRWRPTPRDKEGRNNQRSTRDGRGT